MNNKSTTMLVNWLALGIIVGFGFMLRHQAFTHSDVPDYPTGDAGTYLLYAYNLKNFGVFGNTNRWLHPADSDIAVVQEKIKPDSLVTPGYPVFLSFFFGGEYAKDQLEAIQYAQVILSTITILLTYAAFAPLGWPYGLGAAFLTTLSPHLINMNLFLLTETLFCFLLMAFICLLSKVRQDSRSLLFLAIGIVFAVATLTRPWIQGYLFVLITYLVMSKMRVPVAKTLLIFAAAAVITSPWIIRNLTTLGIAADPRLSVTSIQHGMYPNMMYEGQKSSLGFAYKTDPMSADLAKSLGSTLAELKRRAQDKPAEYLNWYLFGKTRSVLSWGIIAGVDAIFVYPVANSPYFNLPTFYLSSYFMEKIHGLLIFLALVGVVIVWLPKRRHDLDEANVIFLRALSLFVLYFLLMHTIGAPYPRYSIPMRPIIYAMSIYPILFLVQIVRYRFAAGEISTNTERG